MSDRPKIVTACMIVIGNEILSGRTQDANLAWIAVRLNDLGVRLMEARVIPDVEQVIVDTINDVRRRFDYVFTSGGIGPTHDDITADCVAKAFGVGIGVHPEAKRILEAHYIQQKSEFNEARMRMARVPFGGTLIENPVSKAPGFRMENVFVMAGIPAVMRAMFESIRHELVGGAKVLSRTVSSFLPEGKFAAGLGALQVRYPDLDIGSYPFYRQGKPGASIVIRGTEAPMLSEATDELRALIVELGGEPLETDPA
ncbi:MAG TPA: molybdopterin-binding protein [Candidatus Cybelea sp.]|nr:molybdopterin-binding protein [Candidatus Cybelea sp.]